MCLPPQCFLQLWSDLAYDAQLHNDPGFLSPTGFAVHLAALEQLFGEPMFTPEKTEGFLLEMSVAETMGVWRVFCAQILLRAKRMPKLPGILSRRSGIRLRC